MADSPTTWIFTTGGSAGNPMVLAPEPPPPPGENYPTAPVFAIRNGAPLAFTRGGIGGNPTAPPDTGAGSKDELVQGDAWFGTNYRSALVLDVVSLFKYILPPSTSRFYLAGAVTPWAFVNPTTPSNPMLLQPEPPPPPGEPYPFLPVAAIRR